MTGARGPGDELDLLVLGDVNPDLVLSAPDLQPAFGQAETVVDSAHLTIGGSGAIMACAAARLGLRTAIAGVVGEDLFGAFMTAALREHGVDTRGLIVDPARSTGLTVVLARDGDRAILTHPGTIAELTAERIDPELLGAAGHLHVSSYFLQTALRPGLPQLLATARARGATTSLDPNWDPAEGWDGGMSAVLEHVDVLLPNRVEVSRLAGIEDPVQAARALSRQGPPLVVVKLGVEGALAVAPDGEPVHAAPPPMDQPPVDAVGAGDTFDAGCLAAWLAGEPLPRALALACACGALSTRAAGGTAAQPTLKEARRAMRG